MFFSVIVPVYNVEEYLPSCIESVLNQTFSDFELILVNDGSPDNSLSILEEYAVKDERIKIINKENGGLSSARNCAIPLAQGEYIGFVDSDDWIDLDFYEKLYNTAKKYKAEIEPEIKNIKRLKQVVDDYIEGKEPTIKIVMLEEFAKELENIVDLYKPNFLSKRED